MPNDNDELAKARTHLFQGPSGGLGVPCTVCGVPYGIHLAQPIIVNNADELLERIGELPDEREIWIDADNLKWRRVTTVPVLKALAAEVKELREHHQQALESAIDYAGFAGTQTAIDLRKGFHKALKEKNG